MGLSAQGRMTVAQYLAYEETSEVRHEFYNGEIFAMSGGSPDHAFIKENIAIAIGVQLRGKPCRSATSDMRVRIEESGFYTYPDILIVCGELRFAPEDPHSLLNPAVILEILSPTTEKHDRTFKRDQYRRIPSLRQYVLVAQDEMRIESYIPTEVGWSLGSYTASDEILNLAVGDVTLTLAEIYEGITLTKPSESEPSPGA